MCRLSFLLNTSRCALFFLASILAVSLGGVLMPLDGETGGARPVELTPLLARRALLGMMRAERGRRLEFDRGAAVRELSKSRLDDLGNGWVA
jgi:hypothetical protein